MVAANIRLPNVRRTIIPDPGYTIVDADLAGADAQVVAWEAGDEKLKSAFRAGEAIHVFNARTMWEHELRDMTNDEVKKSKYYKPIKAGVHATNYGASSNALVTNCGFSHSFAQDFQRRWFHAHPEIKAWHTRYQRYLQGVQCWNCNTSDLIVGRPCPSCGKPIGRTVSNRFGFRRIYFDRVDRLLPEALAWTPQSTVAFCTELGWVSMEQGPSFLAQFAHAKATEQSWAANLVNPDAHAKWGHIVQFLLQVHDSIIFQVPHKHEPDIPEIVADMQVRVPYPDPLCIRMDFKQSRVSWGDCEKVAV